MILLTVASLALSLALVTTGGAAFIAQLLVAASGSLPPVGYAERDDPADGDPEQRDLQQRRCRDRHADRNRTGRQLGLAPEPFVLAVLFGVNMGYATPMADNCNLLVYSAGNYRFRDFVRVGRAADDHHVAGLELDPAAVLSAALRLTDTIGFVARRSA